MKELLFDKASIFILVFFLLVGVLINIHTYSQHKLFTENKDYIVVLDAEISNVTEGWNLDVDDDAAHEYTISLSYVYDGKLYVNDYWKQISADSYEELYYKKGDTVEIVILSHTPDKIVADNPDDIEFYLREPEPIKMMLYALLAGIIVYVVILIFRLFGKLYKKNKP